MDPLCRTHKNMYTKVYTYCRSYQNSGRNLKKESVLNWSCKRMTFASLRIFFKPLDLPAGWKVYNLFSKRSGYYEKTIINWKCSQRIGAKP